MMPRLFFLALLLLGTAPLPAKNTALEQGFLHPPPSARPWVYWFWLNGNISSNGITADLEAMQRAGIGGVLIMEVDQGTPKGPAPFGSPPWRELFKHVCAEAHRLGLEVNMNNDAGWCGSGGPWITPELAMQKLVWTETNATGPAHFEAALAGPVPVANYYRDITVLAFPTPAGKAHLENLQAKAAFAPNFVAPNAQFPSFAPDQTVARDQVLDLSSKLDAQGHLSWEVPSGKWTILRLGHTPTGKDNHPAPEAGRGLECDKLSRRAVQAMFDGLMGNLVADSKPLAGKSLVSTHIDSWEVGSQNWSPRFREEFRARRGYDLLAWLPAVTGRIIGNTEQTERFLWDLRQTISELVLENYAGYFRELAHRHNLRLSIEAYTTCPVDELAYAGRADEPMGEFWSWPKYMATFSCTEMASAAHVYGKPIVGAEAFTASDQERWLGHPAMLKELGDWAFCEGINRFVFHRYALQPWSQEVRPGMSMGPWGLHYERTQTWWGQSRAWHEYLARCQYLLQQGLFTADICLLTPEGSPQTIDRQKAFVSGAPGYEGQPYDRAGHNFDLCPPEALLSRMSVKHGRLVLPDGMSYQLLALPQCDTMTPRLLRKIKELVHDGATVAGARPLQSPSLSGYPACDAELKALADELWGPGDPTADLSERSYGKGKILCGTRFEQARAANRHQESRLGAAKWIWFNEGHPAASAPVGARYFRKAFHVESAALDSARLVLTADNSFECWVNGQRAGAGDDFTRLYDLDLARLLKPGENVLALTAINGATQPNPAGLIGRLTLKYRDGTTALVPTDATWESATSVAENWRSDLAQGSGWSRALELGALGMAPWGNIEQSNLATDLYPDLDFLNQLLTQRGVPPDFAYACKSEARCLRYIHKRIGETDVYFVANKTAQAQEALCSFRVQGKRPEFWHPDSGQIERPAAYNEGGNSINVPVRLEPSGSVFVVFREKGTPQPERIVSIARNGQPLLAMAGHVAPGAPPSATNFPTLELCFSPQGQLDACVWEPGQYSLTAANGKCTQFQVASLPTLQVTGPWSVAFAPGCGAPPQATFDKLISWSDHSDEGVKYFSGTATYTKTLTVPASALAQGQRLFLDLGEVAVMAEVTVNGKPLGILWKTPYRVEVTPALHPGENALSIQVANLWVNRQIGDELLPEDSERNPNGTLKQWPDWLEKGGKSPAGRHTFTSWRLWKKDSPLQPSGLLGPVTLVGAKELSLP